MFEIRGDVGSAICYAKVVEDEAIEQIKRMCNYELTRDSNIRIMPDVHAGAGCTIGTTMTITDKVCPNVVGVDIGCGMFVVKIEEKNLDFEKIDEAIHKVPSGMNVHSQPIFPFDLTQLKCSDKLKNLDWLKCSLGTLGGGNHFIEINQSSNGDYYFVVHSGSRNLGKQVAEIYQQIAIESHKDKEGYLKKRQEIVDTYKAEGRQSEISGALKVLTERYKERGSDIPDDICWLSGQALKDYFHDIEICQQFAVENRESIAEVLETIGLHTGERFHTIHNYIDTREMILRKGAIAAHKGEKVIIPINMRDGSVIAIGKGNPEWNFSAPHGAGRIMSRKKAKECININDYRQAMAGIYTTSVNEQTLDEAPMVYKSLNDIIDVIKDTVDIIEIIKPVYNFKAAEEEPSWRKDK